MPDQPRGYWFLADANLAAMLRRTAAGEDVELVMAEKFANAVQDRIVRPPAIGPAHTITAGDAQPLTRCDWTGDGEEPAEFVTGWAAVDLRRITFRCDQPGCLSGSVEASPPGEADLLLALIRREHETPGEPA